MQVDAIPLGRSERFASFAVYKLSPRDFYFRRAQFVAVLSCVRKFCWDLSPGRT